MHKKIYRYAIKKILFMKTVYWIEVN